MKSTTYILLSLLLVGFMATAPVLGQNTFTGAQSTAWHRDGNWTGITPVITDDVLIPENLTCIVSGSVDAVAKSIEVESGAVLQVEDGLTLQIRTPVAHTFTALRIDGTVKLGEFLATGVLLVEMTGIGDHIFEMLGNGQLIGNPAELQTTPGPNVVDSIHVGPRGEGPGQEGGLFVKKRGHSTF